MFYSHQLLARKAPLGQIWMAATLHAKMNRRKLDKLDIIKICEEILNPSVPMALRLSGILMGGVVIVYERKVKLLYDDVNRLLVEINDAWRVKAAVPDPTLLPKGKTRAKYEAVTLPDAAEMEMEVEQPMPFGNGFAANGKFPPNGFCMQLDGVDDAHIQIDLTNSDQNHQHHQADAANITLLNDFDSCVVENDLFNRFERFDIDGDEEDAQFFFSQEEPQVPTTLAPSPPREHPQVPTTLAPSHPHESPQEPEGMEDQPMAEQEQQQAEECKSEPQMTEQDAGRKRLLKRKTRACRSHVVLDDEHLIIPGGIYQNWLQDCSDLVSRRRRKLKQLNPVSSTKIGNLIELPPVALVSCMKSLSEEIHYPVSLMELWRKCFQVPNAYGSPPDRRKSSTRAEESSSHSPPEVFFPQDLPEYPPEDYQSEMGSMHDSIEKLRSNLERMDFQGVDGSLVRDRFVTPGSPGRTAMSNHSSGSGNSFLPLDPEVSLPSGRSKRRQHSSSAKSFGNLDPVEEEAHSQKDSRDFKVRRLSEKGPTPDLEILEETGPTQTPHPKVTDPSVDQVTQSIRSHLKVHFDTPGAPDLESLEQLAFGMNRRKAAQLFYQTCVLATLDFVRVQQPLPYADISISRGPKM